jgi:hypothetical protein
VDLYWPPRYGFVILKLEPNFGMGGITESRGKMICGIVVHQDPVDPLIIGLLDYGSVILKLDPNFGTGGITERREKEFAALLCIRIREIRK